MTIQLRVCMLAAAVLAWGLCAEETADAVAVEEGPAEGGTNAVAQAEGIEDPGFERYKTILDRLPFGPEPENFNPDNPSGESAAPGSPEAEAAAEAAAQQEEAQKIIAAVRVSALNVTPKGSVAVGFTDNSKQPPATYYLKVGETRDGWTVKEADAQELTVTLEKDGVDATLKLGEGSDSKDAKKGGGKAGLPKRGLSGRRGGPGLRTPAPDAAEDAAAPAGGSPLANLRARQARAAAARREEQRREEEAAEQAKAERARAAEEREQAKAEREQQQQTLQQIREELQRQREARAQQEQQERQTQGEGGGETGGEGGGAAEPTQE